MHITQTDQESHEIRNHYTIVNAIIYEYEDKITSHDFQDLKESLGKIKEYIMKKPKNHQN